MTMRSYLAFCATLGTPGSSSSARSDAIDGSSSGGRFFTGKTPEASRRVREYLLSTPYENLGRLPLEVPDVISVLLLYFNVLDSDLRILPTEQIAFWQQYSFDGQLNLDRDEMEQADEFVDLDEET